MKLPNEVPVMTLPNATLFPQALLPLYIFEPRYRKMLADALSTHRMFSVALQKPGNKRETPAPVAGLGLIRVSVAHDDGTSHLILQGITRVELEETVRYKPYRVQRIRPITARPCKNEVAADALMAKVRELLADRIKLGLPFPFPVVSRSKQTGNVENAPAICPDDVMNFLDKVTEPDQFTDLISCAVLSGPLERQIILETVDVEARLKHLIHFLMAEIDRHRKNKLS